MGTNQNIASEAEKSTYKLKSDIDTPGEELTALRKANQRKNALLVLAALFIIALSVTLWYVLSALRS